MSTERCEHEPSALENFCHERGIKEVVHFTRLKNVPSILLHGLMSIMEMKKQGLHYYPTDQDRHDNVEDAVCLSISFPNYRMFYNKRRSIKDTFVVLGLNPKILWELQCCFCYSNAANSSISRLLQANRNKLTGLKALQRLFAETILTKELRTVKRDPNIPSYYTTDPQAEVLCLNSIPVHYIQAIYYEHNPDAILKEVSSDWHHLLKQKSDYFRQRQDWKQWSKFTIYCNNT